MKKIYAYLIFISILIITSCTSKTGNVATVKNTENKTQEDLSKLQSLVIETYKDSTVKKVKYFDVVGNKKVFKYYKEFYPNKQVKLEGELKDDKRTGHWVYYYENGVKWSEGNYVNGLAEGKFIIRYDDGNHWMDIYYKNGEKTKEIIYDKSGKIVGENKY